jgi:hypothetical protein
MYQKPDINQMSNDEIHQWLSNTLQMRFDLRFYKGVD